MAGKPWVKPKHQERSCSCRCFEFDLERIYNVLVEIRDKLGSGGSVDLSPVLNKLGDVQREVQNMAGELNALEIEVARNTEVDNSAIALINGLAAKIQELIDSGADPAKLQAFVDSMKSSSDALAAAVAANTPGQP